MHTRTERRRVQTEERESEREKMEEHIVYNDD